jgi:hypothetical protein
MRAKQLDLSQPMARLTEDDVKTQRILMQEMKSDKSLEKQHKWRNEQ